MRDPGSRLLVRSPNWLGDAIMTLPAVNYLQSHLKGRASVSVLAPGGLVELWKGIPGVAEVVAVDRNVWITANALREKKFSSALIFPNSIRTALEPLLAGIPWRVGFHGSARSALLSRRIERRPLMVPRHQAVDYMELVGRFLDQTPVRPELPEWQGLERAEGVSDILMICPGAEYGPAKRWSAAGYAAVGRQLLREGAVRAIRLLGGPKDVEVCRQVEVALDGPCENLAGQTTFGQFIEHLGSGRLVLCNDSGAMHLAALLRVPAVAIFGSTEPRLTGPLHECVRVIRKHVPCSPCFLRDCPIDFACMNGISVEMVLNEARQALAT